MAIEIIATVGASDANSFCTLAEADAFLAIEDAAWAAETDDEVRKQKLVKAQRILTREYKAIWQGSRVDTTQALDWPRYGVEKVDAVGYLDGYGGSGYCNHALYAATEIPQQIKDAQCLLALALLNETYSEGTTERTKSYTTDEISETLEFSTKIGALPTQIGALLSGLVRGTRLVRA